MVVGFLQKLNPLSLEKERQKCGARNDVIGPNWSSH